MTQDSNAAAGTFADSDTSASGPDPAEIERDIRRTQDEMSRTVDRIGDQLSPRNLMNALLDKAEDNNIDARYLIDGARRNPLALGLIAGGLIWLVSDSDAKLPNFRGKSAGTSPSPGSDHHDPHHRDYVAHMERVQRNEGEDDLSYNRRRDVARANYFMLERGHEEDESSFRRRLDDATESFRNKRKALAASTKHAGSALRDRGQGALDTVRQAGGSLRDTGRSGLERAQQGFQSNPLIGGLIAAAAGAIVGTTVPLTSVEEQRLAGLGETARDTLGEQKDRLLSVARDKKDEVLAKVEEAAQPTGSQGNQQESTAGQSPTTPSQQPAGQLI